MSKSIYSINQNILPKLVDQQFNIQMRIDQSVWGAQLMSSFGLIYMLTTFQRMRCYCSAKPDSFMYC